MGGGLGKQREEKERLMSDVERRRVGKVVVLARKEKENAW